ncbi:MAG: hypothetical protein M1832_003074 [Thelocarpon impressellum]|nr:MAG: hypothetical protein M1832_003074 [Thelocarpon impressellum]
MAAGIDYNALRAQTLGSGNDEEAVTVNTRALIDKVLARYSGEWTVLRELLQNAADASASKVAVRFETSPSISVAAPGATDETSILKHTLLHHTLRRLVVTNDGQPFGANDWSRLKRIAEGNPDETKIGAFGVGFYSVFADCEEPLVSSGKEAMAFYWKGNSLFTRRLQLSEPQKETSFVLDYRSSTSPVPQLLPLCQFLATSLTFVGLEAIELWLDGRNLMALSKKAAPSVNVTLPKDVNLKTQEDLMKVHSVDKETVQMDVRWLGIVRWRPPPSLSRIFEGGGGDVHSSTGSAPSLRGFFSRLTGGHTSRTSLRDDHVVQKAVPEDLAAVSTATIFLRIVTGNVRVSVASSFAQEIERATKKRPPQSMRVAILSGALPAAKSVDIFSSVLPNKCGKVFIGFPTQQTTGVTGIHISANSVIPTVEREAIDLNARYVRTWNVELLRAAGIVCRVAWSSDLSDLRNKLSRAASASGKASPARADVTALLPEATHVFRQFTFQDSTPSLQVGQIVEQAFWTSNKQPSIEVFSTQGVLPSHQVRLVTEDLSGFVDGIPVIPESLIEGAPDFVAKLQEYGLITGITTADVKRELEAKALDGNQLGEFLKWAARQALNLEVPRSTTQSLLDVAVATVDGKVIVMADIRCFLIASKIPSDVPVPSNTLPFAFTKGLTKAELEALGWEELQIVPWLRYLVEQSGGSGAISAGKDITLSPTFSGQVLSILSKQWETLGLSSRSSVISLLENRTIIPTNLGMKRPSESYFPSVKLFQDLPIANGLHAVKEKVLVALGVRKTVELSVVFDRLMAEPQRSGGSSEAAAGKWSHVDLIRYLASVREDIPADDIARLRQTPICPAEKDQDPANPTSRRYKFSELYEPNVSLRSLHLPILQWPGVYRSGSSEGKFLASLGLRAVPTVPELVDIMSKAPASGNLALRDRVLTYFIANHHNNGYARYGGLAAISQAYLPLQGEESDKLAAPADCFTNERAAVLGFPILRTDLHPHAAKFGVTSDPPMTSCANILLKRPPANRGEAVLVFSYLASRLHEITQASGERLGTAAIVPLPPQTNGAHNDPSEKARGALRYATPRTCFLGDSAELKEVFDFVDFGSEANAFLLKCGSKHEPTKVQLATMVVQEPARLLGVFQSTEKYLNVLRGLAEHISTLKRDKALFKEMKRSPFLLAYREIPAKRSDVKLKAPVGTSDDLDDEEDTGIKEWSLASASQIVLVDDFISYSLFKENLKVAPQEEKLEEFYHSLGSFFLSNIIEEVPRISSVTQDQRTAAKLQKLVYERSRLFLHDHSPEAVRHDGRWLEKNLTVSQALVILLLIRPKPHSTMMLEMLFSTDLLKLRTRGYNVDRILRAKAAEARIAEDQRQKQIEEEQKKIRDQEEAWNASQSQLPPPVKVSPGPMSVPGAFNESPERDTHRALEGTDPSRKPKGILSSISKRLGLDDGGQSSKQLQNLLGNVARPDESPGHPPPPPYSADDPGQKNESGKKPDRADAVTAPFRQRQNLISAINASRAHDSSNLFSRPDSSNIKETGSYCDERPGHDLSFVADTASGIKIFLSKDVPGRSDFLASQSAGLNLFASLLLDCGQVFALPRGTLHIYYDEAGGTIAFNRQGSLFCNYRFFRQLHLDGMQERRVDAKGEALVYWWVVLCHELAHNLVEAHSSEHSYWTENFVTQYFGKAVAKVAQYSNANAPESGALSAAARTSLLD